MAGTIANSTPYAWPYDAALDSSRVAVLVVTPPGGALGTDPAAWSAAGAIVAAVRAAGGVAISVTTTPPPCGTESQSGLGAVPIACDATVEAFGIDGFFGSRLDAVLRGLGRDQLLLVGRGLETSVHSTMRSANDRGYECLLVLDACEPYDPELVPAARSQIEMSGGIFGAVGVTSDVVAALTSDERQQT
jgi:hypothetical protein